VTRIFKIRVIFGVLFERRKVDKKNKPTQILKHTNSILAYFEHFYQMSSKSIFIIFIYTVSKLVRFFLRHITGDMKFTTQQFCDHSEGSLQDQK